MIILAIDTSCDETAAAVTNDTRVLSNIIYSQVKKHRPHGGVVPNIAKREHAKKLPGVIDQALREANTSFEDLDTIAVTYGPGLAVALEVGIATAKSLAKKYQKPLIAVDHMEGHLLSAFAQPPPPSSTTSTPQEFPALGLLVSGGHTELVLMQDFGEYELVGQTLDDAAGEAFDKVARMLGLPYPGGPEISKRAEQGDENTIDLPVPMKDSGDLNFSFAGLKTASLYRIQKEEKLSEEFVNDFAASFQKTVIEALLIKLAAAVKIYQPKMILLGGGVVANKELKIAVQKHFAGTFPVFAPYNNKLLLDNAAMIGVSAHFKALRNDFVTNFDSLDRVPHLKIGEKKYT